MNIPLKTVSGILLTGLMFFVACTKDPEDSGGHGGQIPPSELPEPDGTATLYPAPEQLPDNVTGRLHRVSVNGQKCFVYRTEATGKPQYGPVYPEYVYFDYDKPGSLLITVEAAYPVRTAEVLPSRHNIRPVVEGNTISFLITGPGHYFVKTNGDESNGSSADKNLYLFVNPPQKEIPSAEDPDVVYFAPGVYPHKVYTLESNKTYYFAPGAFVYGRFFGTGVENVRLCGRGTICGEMLTELDDTGRTVCIKNGSSNIRVEGINIMHPKVWTLAFFQSNDIHVDNVHTISHGMSSDGCDVTSCQNVVVENSFFRGHDDQLAVKARDFTGDMPQPRDCENVVFRNNVVWADASTPMTIGYENDQHIRNIRFEGIDVLNIAAPEVWFLESVMSIQPHGSAGEINGVTFRDIRVDVRLRHNNLFRFSVDGGTGSISNISVEDVWVNYGSTLGGLIYGLQNVPVSGVTLGNIRNDAGAMLGSNKVTTNAWVSGLSVSPDRKLPASVGESWDITNRFSGYSDVQGRFGWYYQYIDAEGMIHDFEWIGLPMPQWPGDASGRWQSGDNCYIGWVRSDPPEGYSVTYPHMTAHMHPGPDKQPNLVWEAPASGKIKVSCQARRMGSGGDGVVVAVRKNHIVPVLSVTLPSTNNVMTDMGTAELEVAAGDKLFFSVDKRASIDYDNTELIPVITYTEVK